MRANRLRDVVADRPVTSFFVLAYAFSWIAWSPLVFGVEGPLQTASFIAGGFGPAVAGAVTTWLAGDSVRAWARQIVYWRVAPRWYLVAFGLPLLVVALGTVGIGLASIDVDLGLLPGRTTALVVGYVTVALVGGGNEEPGWRGFALPRLQDRHDPLRSTLVLGVVWAFWHVPLLASGPTPLSGMDALGEQAPTIVLQILNIVGFAFLLTWVYNGTNSVLLALLTHAGFNTANSTLVPLPLDALAGADSTAVLVAITVAVWVVAIALVVLTGGRLGYDGTATSLDAGRDASPLSE
ncbi:MULTISPECIES: CPBP family intramembrane glutamic endopeptidase [Haloferax]|uniref:CPBP family intramembrane metalloprotease n=2 Tax=Haloferax TaxID=2251 RepID=A0A6G1Z1R2_9EURY|nr:MULTISPECIES: type II CAAX endopeptidase family protein [Haloferax]KAB1187764.1 CPBP family intramembrane metalloprotease [Haloferax sp. CBA1149]MRW80425.1 CPBP family intramembrane metalloprotease [Haloferax marinisediminis]